MLSIAFWDDLLNNCKKIPHAKRILAKENAVIVDNWPEVINSYNDSDLKSVLLKSNVQGVFSNNDKVYKLESDCIYGSQSLWELVDPKYFKETVFLQFTQSIKSYLHGFSITQDDIQNLKDDYGISVESGLNFHLFCADDSDEVAPSELHIIGVLIKHKEYTALQNYIDEHNYYIIF